MTNENNKEKVAVFRTHDNKEKKGVIVDDRTPDEYYALLRKELLAQFSEKDVEEIDKAYKMASESHKGQFRISGQPYVVHPLFVAKNVLDLGMDKESIIAALLHDVVEDTDTSMADVEKVFGASVAQLVDGVTKLGKVPTATKGMDKSEEQAENVRKMLLAMSEDIRVIIIKLADRLHNMRTLDFMPPHKQREKALETLEVYAPIAHRLGIRAVKDELEDLAISHLDPIGYHQIEEELDEHGASRIEYLEKIKTRIMERVQKSVPSAHIDGRIKSIHGIYRKMYMRGREFDEIYDIYAVRIIVDTVIDCYNCLGIIHDMFRPIPGRFKDYISTPKPNMYQSLHTTVLGNEGVPFEVQIRTWEMHYTAEYGIAAHWKYKLGDSSGKKFEERLTWIRQLLESQKDSEDVEDIVRTIKTDLAPEEVFVFTPRGDVTNLPMGSTVIDFAYAIHSEVGNKMVGAKVDGRIVPIEYKVKTGEIVEILTSSQMDKGPSRDWLNIVKTSEARSKIRAWFKREKRPENIEAGKEEIDRIFRRNNIHLYDEDLRNFIQKLSDRQHMQSVDDFYAAIGYGGLSVTKMLPRIKDEYNKILRSKQKNEEEIKIVPQQHTSTDGVIVEGIDNCLIKFSKCCNPLPGDDIIGYITRGHGVSIHTRKCKNVPQDISRTDEPDRWITAYWDNKVKENYKATLLVTCNNRVGIIADITSTLANMHVMIHSFATKEITGGRFQVLMTISVTGMQHLESIMQRVEKTDGVLSVERSGI